MDLGAPVFKVESMIAVGFVSYIPEGNLQGKPIIMTNLVELSPFIEEKTGFTMEVISWEN